MAEKSTSGAAASADSMEEHPAASPLPAQPATAEETIAAQRKEYGQWVAAQQIFSGNALVYNPLDPVPASNVELHGYDKAGLVLKTGSKAHDELRKRIHGQ